MTLDGRIIILAIFTLGLWGLNAAAQRFDKNADRVKVNWVVAMLAGSRNQCVIWRNLTIQIGVIVNFVCYSLLVAMTGHANLVVTGILAFLIMLVLQQRPPKDCKP
jgi:hypothetical protein